MSINKNIEKKSKPHVKKYTRNAYRLKSTPSGRTQLMKLNEFNVNYECDISYNYVSTKSVINQNYSNPMNKMSKQYTSANINGYKKCPLNIYNIPPAPRLSIINVAGRRYLNKTCKK